MILDKVYFIWAGTREALAGTMWFDSRRISAGYRLLLTTLINSLIFKMGLYTEPFSNTGFDSKPVI